VKIRAEMDRLQCAIEANSLFPREKKTRVAVVKRRKRRAINAEPASWLAARWGVIEPRNE
jgi:hypothetical protein